MSIVYTLTCVALIPFTSGALSRLFTSSIRLFPTVMKVVERLVARLSTALMLLRSCCSKENSNIVLAPEVIRVPPVSVYRKEETKAF